MSKTISGSRKKPSAQAASAPAKKAAAAPAKAPVKAGKVSAKAGARPAASAVPAGKATRPKGGASRAAAAPVAAKTALQPARAAAARGAQAPATAVKPVGKANVVVTGKSAARPAPIGKMSIQAASTRVAASAVAGKVPKLAAVTSTAHSPAAETVPKLAAVTSTAHRSAAENRGRAETRRASDEPRAAKAPAKASAARVDVIGQTGSLPEGEMLFVFENVQPAVDNGLYAAKREVGDTLEVAADVMRYGHDKFDAWFELRPEGGEWARYPLEFLENDRYVGSAPLSRPGLYEFRIGGTDHKYGAEETSSVFELVVDPVVARFGAWYEMWARSQGTDPSRSASFAEMKARLPEIASMGFQVLYLPPIHPIGKTNRKGANNALRSQPGEPGCPYAIGNEVGGHDAVDPELGTMTECEDFIRACGDHGLQVALDIALNCSPDHPWAKEHPDWFFREPDGTIKFAENPPKKYEDIYALDYLCADRENLWRELLRVHLFWIEKGIRIFRIDNPHTKPFTFWKWLIREVKLRCPDAVFLSEAFTRPKPMKNLAKLGFQQSYTYFIWRNSAEDLREYVTELTREPEREYMRGNFFTSTPDINPFFLQEHGRPGFLIRQALAALLMPAYGVYNGFELCEARGIPGKEEFLDSEKYQYKTWDWERPGNIKEWIRILNEIRNTHPALQEYHNTQFHGSSNPNLLVFSRIVGDDKLLCIVNCDPRHAHDGHVEVPWSDFGIEHSPFYVTDLVTRQVFTWHGAWNYVRLDPAVCPAHVLRIGG